MTRRFFAAVEHGDLAGLEALLLDGQERLIGVCALEIAGGRITAIRGVVNPDKLRHLGAVGDLASLLGSARSPGRSRRRI